MQGRFLGNSGELNPEIWDAANVRFCLNSGPSESYHPVYRHAQRASRTFDKFLTFPRPLPDEHPSILHATAPGRFFRFYLRVQS